MAVWDSFIFSEIKFDSRGLYPANFHPSVSLIFVAHFSHIASPPPRRIPSVVSVAESDSTAFPEAADTRGVAALFSSFTVSFFLEAA